MMRSALLTGVSFTLTGLVFLNAYFYREQFYPSVVYITKSNSSMAVIYLQAFVMVMLIGKLMSKVFFGRLRAAEFEHLMERSWYAITETCLAFTVFKDDFSPKFVALFSLLLFLKSFHWLAEDRVDYMERSPSVSVLFHIRVVSLSIMLASIDLFFISHAYHSTLTKGASVQLVFGFEYAILLTIVVNTVIKYILNSIDLHSENPWEGKAVCLLYAELILGFVKVLFYVLFIVIMVRIYSLPLFAVRPMYLTMRGFKKAFNDVIMSRRAIHNMNTWYPDATEEELANTDNVCIICREEMLAPTTKKLPCNHIFHKNCLRSWFQRQQTCPTCRLDILRSPQATRVRQAAPPAPAVPAQPAAVAAAPQQPPMPPFDPNLLAHMMANQRFGFPAPFPPAAPPQQQPTAATTTASTTATATTATATTATATTAAATTTTTTAAGISSMPTLPPLPPFPSFAFAPPPYTVPPPMPPANFTGMTDQELSALEGNERANVEARVKCLRNIQVLLDAAVLEMQQYTTVMHRMGPIHPSSEVKTETKTVVKNGDKEVNPEVKTETKTVVKNGDKEVKSEVKKENKEAKSEAKLETPNSGDNAPKKETGAIPKSGAKVKPVDEVEADEIVKKMDAEDPNEIRRRRLEKLEKIHD